MNKAIKSFLVMIRAPFLSSIISPITAGLLISWISAGHINALRAVIVIFLGLCLHIATNVYNDIYDTLQGTDMINRHRNQFSGGSGVLVDDPDKMQAMYIIARTALAGACIAGLILFFLTGSELRYVLAGLVVLSLFFSKFYTAAPVKLAYRGWGEVSVWFAFGPMAVLVAAVSQNVGLNPLVLAAMPVTGLSTLSILLLGQMIDLEADRQGGKWGIAVRLGTKQTAVFFAAVQSGICVNIIGISLVDISGLWPVLISLVPYAVIMPRLIPAVLQGHDDPEALKKAAGMNVSLHLLFSLLLSAGLFISGMVM